MVDIVNVGWTCTRWVTLHVRIRPCIDYYCLCLNLQDSFWKADGSLERLKTLTGLRSKSHRSLTYGMACSSCRLLCNPEEENMYLPELLCSSQDTEACHSPCQQGIYVILTSSPVWGCVCACVCVCVHVCVSSVVVIDFRHNIFNYNYLWLKSQLLPIAITQIITVSEKL